PGARGQGPQPGGEAPGPGAGPSPLLGEALASHPTKIPLHLPAPGVSELWLGVSGVLVVGAVMLVCVLVRNRWAGVDGTQGAERVEVDRPQARAGDLKARPGASYG
ncbi:MAG: hypothetical protein P8R43_00060, partial [Planctomycetota bacterium]|nr:hypothetical protein [Planctomycetota bacterium]